MGTILKQTNAIVGKRTYTVVNQGNAWFYQLVESFICIPMYYSYNSNSKEIQYYWIKQYN